MNLPFSNTDKQTDNELPVRIANVSRRGFLQGIVRRQRRL